MTASTCQRKGNGQRLNLTGDALPDGDHATAVRWLFRRSLRG